jgi:hypothetical protein
MNAFSDIAAAAAFDFLRTSNQALESKALV